MINKKLTKSKKDKTDFTSLVKAIQNINAEFSNQAKQAVNINLTLRNLFIGGFIANYELRIQAKYGENLLQNLTKSLKNVSNCNRRQLYDYLQFYRIYPQIAPTVSAQSQMTAKTEIVDNLKIVPTVLALSPIEPEKLISRL